MIYIGILVLIHTAFSLSNYIRYKRINNEEISIPVDLKLEILISIILMIFFIFKNIYKLKSIKEFINKKSFESSFKGITKTKSKKSEMINFILNNNYKKEVDEFLKKF